MQQMQFGPTVTDAREKVTALWLSEELRLQGKLLEVLFQLGLVRISQSGAIFRPFYPIGHQHRKDHASGLPTLAAVTPGQGPEEDLICLLFIFKGIDGGLSPPALSLYPI